MQIVCHEVLHYRIEKFQGPHKNADVISVICADGRTVELTMFIQSGIPQVPKGAGVFSTSHNPGPPPKRFA